MADVPYMPLFCEPLLADTEHLNDAEMGLYTRMLVRLWLAPNQRFPNDLAWLARKFRRTEEEARATILPLVEEFFQRDGNWVSHKRLSREFERVSAQLKKQSDRAKSRWDKEKSQSRGNASPEVPSTSTSTVTEERGIPPSEPPAKPKRTKAPQGTLLPDDWTPTDDDREYARAKGFGDIDINELADEFRNYWLGVAGPSALKRDWSAVWRSRVVAVAKLGIRSSRRGPGGSGSGGGDRRAGDRQAGRLADTLAVLHRRGSLAGPYFDEARMGRFPH